MQRNKTNLISYLNKYYAQHNIFFGEIIHNLKPRNIREWAKFLATKKWYLISGLSQLGYTKTDKNQWIWYLKNSFWKLYTSETRAIEYFKEQFDIDLELVDQRQMDVKYGIDLKFNNNNFVIVKSSLYDEEEIRKLLEYKQLKYFCYKTFNLSNSKLWVFVSKTSSVYLYDHISDNLIETQVIK